MGERCLLIYNVDRTINQLKGFKLFFDFLAIFRSVGRSLAIMWFGKRYCQSKFPPLKKIETPESIFFLEEKLLSGVYLSVIAEWKRKAKSY